MSQVESALFNDHVSSALLLVCRAGNEENILNLGFKTSFILFIIQSLSCMHSKEKYFPGQFNSSNTVCNEWRI